MERVKVGGEEDRAISLEQKSSLQEIVMLRICRSFRHICKEVKKAVKVTKEKEWVRFRNELQDTFYKKSKLFWKKVKGTNIASV